MDWRWAQHERVRVTNHNKERLFFLPFAFPLFQPPAVAHFIWFYFSQLWIPSSFTAWFFSSFPRSSNLSAIPPFSLFIWCFPFIPGCLHPHSHGNAPKIIFFTYFDLHPSINPFSLLLPEFHFSPVPPCKRRLKTSQQPWGIKQSQVYPNVKEKTWEKYFYCTTRTH